MSALKCKNFKKDECKLIKSHLNNFTVINIISNIFLKYIFSKVEDRSFLNKKLFTTTIYWEATVLQITET